MNCVWCRCQAMKNAYHAMQNLKYCRGLPSVCCHVSTQWLDSYQLTVNWSRWNWRHLSAKTNDVDVDSYQASSNENAQQMKRDRQPWRRPLWDSWLWQCLETELCALQCYVYSRHTWSMSFWFVAWFLLDVEITVSLNWTMLCLLSQALKCWVVVNLVTCDSELVNWDHMIFISNDCSN